jgi:hypothetical protein
MSPEEMPGKEATEPRHKIARWSAGRRARRSQGGRRASQARPLHVRRSALRRPSSGGKTKVQESGRECAAATKAAVSMAEPA